MTTLERLKKSLLNLWTGELAAILVFIFTFFILKGKLHMDLGLIIIYPFTLLILVLLQGSYYWFHCLKRLNKRVINPNRFKNFYKAFKILDLVIIIFFPLKFIYSWSTEPQISWENTLIALVIYLFAIAEYINYFFVRLSYSNWTGLILLIKSQRQRKSALNKELSKK